MTQIPFSERPTCSIPEACKATGVSRSKIYMLLKSGDVKGVHVGKRHYVKVPSLLSFLENGKPSLH